MRASGGLALVLIVALVPVAGCGEDSGTATVTETETTTEPATVDEGSNGSEGIDSGSGGGGGGGDITVPDVVGEDHQLAQDTMQAAGLYSLDEQDASGQDRLLIWDRNWTVVRQDPPAGTKVSEDETITLYSKKDGE